PIVFEKARDLFCARSGRRSAPMSVAHLIEVGAASHANARLALERERDPAQVCARRGLGIEDERCLPRAFPQEEVEWFAAECSASVDFDPESAVIARGLF